jgi:hypothetical protein
MFSPLATSVAQYRRAMRQRKRSAPGVVADALMNQDI